MTGYAGRLFLLAHETTPSSGTYTDVAGLQDLTLTINNETVDVTAKSDAGVRQLLNAKVLTSFSFSGSGVARDSATLKVLRDNANAGTAFNYRITTPGDSTAGVTYTGAFIITSFEEAGGTTDAQTFSISAESSSAVTIASLT